MCSEGHSLHIHIHLIILCCWLVSASDCEDSLLSLVYCRRVLSCWDLQPVAPDTLLELLREAVESSARQGKGLVISGFPRDLRRAQEYEAKVGEPSAVFLLKCSADAMSSRQQCRARSTSTFHPVSDRDSVLHRKAESFCRDNQAVASYYEDKKVLHTIDAERSPDEVFAQICQAMETF